MRCVLVLLVACGTTPSAPSTNPSPPRDPEPIPRDAAPPVTIAAPVCADAEACHHEAEDFEAEGFFVKAADSYLRACDFGDKASCFAAGLVLRSRIEPLGPDSNGSHAAFVKACEQGVADGCAQVGTDLFTGMGVAEDRSTALVTLDAACTKGSGLACYNLGVFAREGAVVARDPKAAYARFEQGCTAGFAAACTEQAIALYDGAGVKRDRALATTIADAACAGKAEQCAFRAELYQKEKRFTEARALSDKACGAGSGLACHNLGVMLEKGLGGAKDAVRAKELREKACMLRIAADCPK